METLSQHIATNMQVWEVIKLFNLTRDINEQNIIHKVFDDSPDGPLYDTTTADGAFVLQPKAGSFSELQQIVNNIFGQTEAVKQQKQQQRIEIRNGTNITGLAFTVSEKLKASGYNVPKIGNAPTRDYQKTVVYNLANNPNDQTTLAVAQILKAQVAATIPSWVTATDTPQFNSHNDILIILGQDQK
jgi:hypothetical protein